MTPSQTNEWQHLAERASKEMDPEKLVNLVTQLNRVLGEQEERSGAQQHQGNDGISFNSAV